jgi:hypothetical protein
VTVAATLTENGEVIEIESDEIIIEEEDTK